MNSFARSIMAVGLVFVLHAAGVLQGLYGAWPWYDIPMHFLGGYAMAILGLDIWYAFVHRYEVEGKGALAGGVPGVVMFVAVLGFVALVSIGWEWFEFLVDQLADGIRLEYGIAQASVKDTMGDFVMDLIGGTLGYALFYRGRTK